MSETSRFRFSLLLREIENCLHDDTVSSLALALIHLDGLDEINERFGYLGGDKVLEAFADRLADQAGDQDLTFDISGTCFAMLLRNRSNQEQVLLAAHRIAEIAAEPVMIGSGQAASVVNIGVSMLPDPADTAEALIRQCEKALGHARTLQEPIVCYTLGMTGDTTIGAAPTLNLREALEADELKILYQPRVSLRDGRLAGAEAVIRWQMPGGELLPVSLFMPPADDPATMRMMCWYWLDHALKSTASWARDIPGFLLSLQLPANAFELEELVDMVGEAIALRQYPAHLLALEVTDRMLADDPGGLSTVKRLAGLGVRLTLADYGAESVNPSKLKDIQLHGCMLDSLLVRSATGDDTDRRIVAALCQLADALGMSVGADGVDGSDAMETLLALGVDHGQGSYFDVPMKAEEFCQRWITRFARSAS